MTFTCEITEIWVQFRFADLACKWYSVSDTEINGSLLSIDYFASEMFDLIGGGLILKEISVINDLVRSWLRRPGVKYKEEHFRSPYVKQ